MRLILPGDGCLLCWGGVANAQEALERWQRQHPRRPWNEERAGSLRSLNSIAAHLGIRLLEDLVAGHLRRSVWLRLECDESGIPFLQSLPARRLRGCDLCLLLGTGDWLEPISSLALQKKGVALGSLSGDLDLAGVPGALVYSASTALLGSHPLALAQSWPGSVRSSPTIPQRVQPLR